MAFDCNLHTRHIPKSFKAHPFLYDIILAWCKLNFQEHVNPQSDCIVWNNSNILVNGKIMFSKQLNASHVNFLSDFFTGGLAMEHDVFCARHNVQINFITYLGIVKAIIEYKKIASMTL